MNNGRTDPKRFLPQDPGSLSIDRKGRARIAFSLVHGRIRRRIHDPPGLHLPHHGTYRSGIRQVKFGPCQANNVSERP
jgi:hypothetical protein